MCRFHHLVKNIEYCIDCIFNFEKIHLIALTIISQNPKTKFGIGWKVEEGCEDLSGQELSNALRRLVSLKRTSSLTFHMKS